MNGLSSIRILHVDDDPAFTSLTADILENKDEQFTVETALSATEGLDRLAEDNINCIVSGYNMPRMDGIEFLETVREEYPDLPFILFTGQGSEAVASEAISTGVTDYLQKTDGTEHFELLANRIDNAIELTRTQRERQRHLDAIETTREGIAIFNDGGEMIYVNEAFADLYGYDPKEMIGERWELIYQDEDVSMVHDEILPALEENGHWRGETIGLRADGSTFVEDHTLALSDGGEVVCTIQDITEHKDRKQELELKTRAMDEAPVGIVITDPTQDDNPITYANDQFQQLTGYPEDEILGRNCRFLQGEATDPESVAKIREAIDNQEPVTVELRNYRKDGTEFWTRVNIAPVESDDGDVTNFVGFQQDVTEKEERKQELQLNERRFEAVFEDPNILVGLLEPDGTVIDINGTAMAYVDLDLSDITGDLFWKTPWFAGDDALQSEVKELAERAAGGEYVEFELDLSGAVGHHLVISGVFRPVTNDDGDVVSLIISDRDITERKQQKEELAESEARYESLTEDVLDTSEVGTFILDENFDVVWINSAVEEFFGIDRETVVGENKRDLSESQVKHVFENPDTVQKRLLESYEHNDRIEEFEAHVLESKDTEERWVRHWSQPIESGLYEGGRIEHYSDVTERKRRENQLSSLDRMLRHNMQNAMNVIQGRAEIIAQDTSGEVQDNAETISSSADSLLDMTGKQREVVELLTENPDPRPMDISTIVRESAQKVRTAYPDADVTVDVPENVRANAVLRVDSAITELLENGIIHTVQADPEVRVSIIKSNSRICVRITDSGPGIPEEEQLVLQGEGEQGPLDHGRGMGLSLVNRVIAYCDGYIEYYYDEDNVTTVELWLQEPPAR